MVDNSSILFTNNTIRNSSSFGIIVDANAGFQSFTGNTIFSCANHLISISTKHLPDLGTPNTFTAETGKGIQVSGDVQYANDVIWKKQTADFYITGGENDIDGNITIEAGSTFMFVNDSYFYFGYYANTKISAVGTSTSKITFTSSASSPSVHGKASTLPVIHLQILNLLIVIFCTQECRGNLLFILRSQLELPLLHTMNGFLSSRCSIMGLLECFEITGRGIHKPGNSRKALHFSLNGRQPS